MSLLASADEGHEVGSLEGQPWVPAPRWGPALGSPGRQHCKRDLLRAYREARTQELHQEKKERNPRN